MRQSPLYVWARYPCLLFLKEIPLWLTEVHLNMVPPLTMGTCGKTSMAARWLLCGRMSYPSVSWGGWSASLYGLVTHHSLRNYVMFRLLRFTPFSVKVLPLSLCSWARYPSVNRRVRHPLSTGEVKYHSFSGWEVPSSMGGWGTPIYGWAWLLSLWWNEAPFSLRVRQVTLSSKTDEVTSLFSVWCNLSLSLSNKVSPWFLIRLVPPQLQQLILAAATRCSSYCSHQHGQMTIITHWFWITRRKLQ